MKSNFLTSIDKIWCANHQVPASLLSSVSSRKNVTITLASFRFFLVLALFAELLGYFFITVGLSPFQSIYIFLFGVILKICGAVGGAFFQNKSGTFLSLELQGYLKNLKTHALEIRSFLADAGCSESEINSLQTLPSEVYQSELNGYQRSKISNIGTPIACGLGLLVVGDLVTSVVVIAFGLLSFPIGEKFFKESTFRKESELRLGLAAQLLSYVRKIYNEHIWLTTKVNFLSQLPLLLFAFRFIWNSSTQLLSSFFALTQGLAGLTGTLAFQKSRVASIRTTSLTTHLINALSSPYLIVTPQRWQEHCTQHKKTEETKPNKSGILLKNFSPNVPFHEKEHFSISCFIPAGSVCLIRAPSGKGKSTLLSSLSHLIEHQGELLLQFQDKVLDVHDLHFGEFEKYHFFFRDENVENSTRLIDLYKKISYQTNSAFLEQARGQFDPQLVDLAWKVPDNLLEQEIKKMERGEAAVFPPNMLSFLKELREKQITEIQASLNHGLGNLESKRIFPERNFVTLSSGEKKRLTLLLGYEFCKNFKEIKFLILDEPLTHLDGLNIDYQLQIIKQIQNLDSPPSILIISHHFIDELKGRLSGVQEITL